MLLLLEALKSKKSKDGDVPFVVLELLFVILFAPPKMSSNKLFLLVILFVFWLGFKLLSSPEFPKSKRSLLLFELFFPSLNFLILICEVLLFCALIFF